MARETGDKRAVIEANVEVVYSNEAMCALEDQASAEKLLILSTVKNHNSLTHQSTTTLAKLHIAKETLAADLDQPKA